MQPLSLRARRVIDSAAGFDDATEADRDRVRSKLGVALAAGAAFASSAELSRAAEFSLPGDASQSAQAPLATHSGTTGLLGTGGKVFGISKALGAMVVAVGAAAAAAIGVWGNQPASPETPSASTGRSPMAEQPQDFSVPLPVEGRALPPRPAAVPIDEEPLPLPAESAAAAAPPELSAHQTPEVAPSEPPRAQAQSRRGAASLKQRPTGPATEPRPELGRTDSAPEVSAPVATASLAAELSALSQVRLELASGSPERALHLLTNYEKDFPSPVFGIEAKALQVDALCAAQQPELSHQAAKVFLSRWPTSPLAERVRKACQ